MKRQVTLKPKYDLWFFIVLAIILWTLATQFINYVFLLIPLNLTNIGIWARTLATGIALFGAIWVTKVWLRSIKGSLHQDKEEDNEEPIRKVGTKGTPKEGS